MSYRTDDSAVLKKLEAMEAELNRKHRVVKILLACLMGVLVAVVVLLLAPPTTEHCGEMKPNASAR